VDDHGGGDEEDRDGEQGLGDAVLLHAPIDEADRVRGHGGGDGPRARR
jgi:hypothetical protein